MCVPATNMPYKCHILKLVNVHIWVRYANIYVMYELAAINNVTRNAVPQMVTMMTTTVMQPDCKTTFDHLAKSPKEATNGESMALLAYYANCDDG